MAKERITDKEARATLTSFFIGSSIMLGIGSGVMNDAWLAGVIGMALSIPIILIYIRIQNLYHGQDLFDMLISIWGEVFGRIAAVLYMFYAFHLGALVFRNFGEFVHTTSFPETPMMVIILAFCIVCIAAARSGVEVISRISTYILPVVFAILAILQLMSIPTMHFKYIKPVLANGLAPVLQAGFSVFSFPFAESVLFLGVFYTLKEKKSASRVYFSSLVFSGLVLLISTVSNILILGRLVDHFYFPSHISAGRIKIGNFLQRLEGTMAVSFLVTAFIKGSVCLFVACKGLARVFNLDHYKFIVIQMGLLMAYLALILYDNILEMQLWASDVYPLYALPFQVILPVMIWITAEIRNRKKKR